MSRIAYLFRKEIDNEKWNSTATNISGAPVYLFTWFLDSFKEDWRAVIEQNDAGEYISLFPFQVGRKAGHQFIKQNPFLPFTGVFSLYEDATRDAVMIETAINDFVYVQKITLNRKYDLSIQLKQTIVVDNYTIDLSANKENDVFLSLNRKRDLRKATKAGLSYDETNDLRSFIELHKQYVSPRIKGFRHHQYAELESIYQVAVSREKTFIAHARSQNGQVIASAVFLVNDHSIVYYASAASTEGKKSGAATFILSKVIQKYAGQDKILDFNGGDIPGIARFYIGLGGRNCQLYSATHYRFNPLLEFIFLLRRRIFDFLRRRAFNNPFGITKTQWPNLTNFFVHSQR